MPNWKAGWRAYKEAKKQPWVEEEHFLPDGSRMWKRSSAAWTVFGCAFFGLACLASLAFNDDRRALGAAIGVAVCFFFMGTAMTRLFPKFFLTFPKDQR